MDKNNIQPYDDMMKDLLSGSKMKASENLKFRIMQQIETEKALAPKKVSSAQPVINNMFAIFGIMYAIIGILGFYIYSSGGMDALLSVKFFVPALFVFAICGMYWMLTAYDERRRSRQKQD
ncbi:hypothetical protein [Dysgonomonas sp. 511]|uniref:hypothetical protein n=1 Tax=Dysgonomonas sp. 511 TaxID=2302930 RepID=UPI0013D76484|nr:hypothetical protein [Dysgonomonas sp. 511]NDV77958.1 hypothetical protein [Dysgonomonas sp. 511]